MAFITFEITREGFGRMCCCAAMMKFDEIVDAGFDRVNDDKEVILVSLDAREEFLGRNYC